MQTKKTKEFVIDLTNDKLSTKRSLKESFLVFSTNKKNQGK